MRISQSQMKKLLIVASQGSMLLAKVTAIEGSKYLATLPLDELIGNLKVYEIDLENDGVVSKSTKEKVNDEGEDNDEGEEFNLMARNFQKFFYKSNRFGHANRFGNGGNRFGRGIGNGFGNKGARSSRQKRGCYDRAEKGYFIDLQDLKKENEELLKFYKDFTNTFKKLLKEKRSLKNKHSKLFSKISELEFEVKKLTKGKEVVEPYQRLDDWTMDSRCTKHITWNRILFTMYNECDYGHVVFTRNLKGKVIGGGNISHDSIAITNVEHFNGLAFNLISHLGSSWKKSTRLGLDSGINWTKMQLFKLANSILTPSPKVPRKWLSRKKVWLLSRWRRRQNYLLTLSGSSTDDITMISDGVTITDMKKPLEDSKG
ncbi:hypothetical protein Tco_1275150 [Tanacetum coccineum]